YIGINGGDYISQNSVHLQYFPDYSMIPYDDMLVVKMDKVQDICSSALFIRNANNLRVRQPLSNLKIIASNNDSLEEFSEIIMDEINVKQVLFENNLEDFADFKLNINFQILGKRLPGKIKDIISESKKGVWSKEGDKIKIAGEILEHEECSISLVPKISNENEFAKSLQDSEGLVVLDGSVSEGLIREGYARDVIRFIQSCRKEAKFNISDKIELNIVSEDMIINQSIDEFRSFIEEQTLSFIIQERMDDGKVFTRNCEIDGLLVKINLRNIL
ncbi:MAG: DUF5915 domain-containing protein, partial [Rickettsiaceae bacterium]|nr:DUF5915 domain-containing protein [Rickettsiaceae bacterium]